MEAQPISLSRGQPRVADAQVGLPRLAPSHRVLHGHGDHEADNPYRGRLPDDVTVIAPDAVTVHAEGEGPDQPDDVACHVEQRTADDRERLGEGRARVLDVVVEPADELVA